MTDVETIIQPVDQGASAGAIARAIPPERIETHEGIVGDRPGMRHLIDVVDRAAGGALTREQGRRTFQYLHAIEIGGIHDAVGHFRRTNLDTVVERIDLGAGEATHRERGGRSRRVAGRYAHGSLRHIGGRPQAAIFNGLLVDHVDRGRNFPDGQPQARGAFGNDIAIERRVRNLAALRSRRWNRRCGGRCTGAADSTNTRGGAAALRAGLSPTHRLSLWWRNHDRPEILRLLSRLWRPLCGSRRRGPGGNKCKQAERCDGGAPPTLDVGDTGLTGSRAGNAWRKMAMIYEIRQITARRRSPYPSARLLLSSALAPSGRYTSYSCDIGAPRPTRSRVTMTGSRFPGSRVIASDHLPRDLVHLQWYLWSSAIRLQLRGQPRICVLARTHRIPLASPCGTTGHKRGIRSC
jgi:hypothetical protein